MAALHLTLPVAPESASTARRQVRGLGLPGATTEVLTLLLTELVANAVRHAGLPDESRIDLAVEVEDERIRGEVADEGPSFTWRSQNRPPDRPGGLGLVLVDRLSDRWGIVRDRGTRVWFEIDGAAEDATAAV